MHPKPLYFANLLSLPHLVIKKTKGKKPLVDYNQSHINTPNEYSNISQQKTMENEVIEEIRRQKKKEKEEKKIKCVVNSLPQLTK
jgi:hypothetical protein